MNLDQNKLYAFPKASIAINLHNFDFLNNSNSISQFKLRTAWGQTGGLPNFGTIFNSLAATNVDGKLGVTASTSNFDPTLEPERASELELGVDIGILDNKIIFEGTYYNKQVFDLILPLTPAEATGVADVFTNAADLRNEGFELGLTFNPVRSAGFNWTSRVLYWQNRSEITELNIPEGTVGGFGPGLGTYIRAQGQSPTLIVGTPNIGEDAPGTLGFTPYGDRQPDFTMTWFNSFQFAKNFEAGMLLHYQNGGSAINLSRLLWFDGGSYPDYAGDDDGDGTINAVDFGDAQGAGRWVQPTDYLKLREVSIYYTLPSSVLSGDLIDRIKIGVSANNLLLWTDYESYDPEVSNFGNQPVASAIEVTPFPSSRRIFFHLKADF